MNIASCSKKDYHEEAIHVQSACTVAWTSCIPLRSTQKNYTTNTSRGQNYCCLLLQHGKVVIKLLSTIPCLYSLLYRILFKLNKAPTKWCLHNWQHPCSQVRNLKQKHKPKPKYKESLRPNPCYDQRTYFHNNRDVGDFVTLSSGAEVNCHEAIKMLMINMITFTL